MAVAAVLTGAALAAAAGASPVAWAPAPDIGARLTYIAVWCLPPVICMAAMIGIVARARFSSFGEMDPAELQSAKKISEYRNILQNTSEQVLLAVLTYVIWALLMPVGFQIVAAASSVMFVLGRILFFEGYRRGAASRALGFGLTFYPTVFMITVISGRVLRSLAL